MQTEIKIESNIPIPESKTGPKYPFAQMEVGDSFFCASGLSDQLRNSLRNNAYRFKPKSFVIRKVDGGLRVWRTA